MSGGDDHDDAPVRIGFACHWTEPRPASWSGTPWHLREALAARAIVDDLAVNLPRVAERALRLAGARRTTGGWRSTWRHGDLTRSLLRRRLRGEAARRPPDLVLEIQDLGPTDAPFAVLQDLSYSLLLELYGPDGVPHFRALGRARIDRLRRIQEDTYAEATWLLPMSRWLGDHLVDHGVPAERVRVVNPGANVGVLPGTPVPERRRGRVRRLLFVGRDFDTKGGSQVVAAVRELRRDLGDAVSLTVAGPETWPLRGEPPDGVHFLGRVDGRRVGELMDTHDLFVMPSHLEGFGIVFAEALMRGLPCVGRDACAMPEIIDPVSAGRLVTSDDPGALATLVAETLADDDLYVACAAAAEGRRRHFSWDRAAADVVDVARATRGA